MPNDGELWGIVLYLGCSYILCIPACCCLHYICIVFPLGLLVMHVSCLPSDNVPASPRLTLDFVILKVGPCAWYTSMSCDIPLEHNYTALALGILEHVAPCTLLLSCTNLLRPNIIRLIEILAYRAQCVESSLAARRPKQDSVMRCGELVRGRRPQGRYLHRPRDHMRIERRGHVLTYSQ